MRATFAQAQAHTQSRQCRTPSALLWTACVPIHSRPYSGMKNAMSGDASDRTRFFLEMRQKDRQWSSLWKRDLAIASFRNSPFHRERMRKTDPIDNHPCYCLNVSFWPHTCGDLLQRVIMKNSLMKHFRITRILAAYEGKFPQ